MRLDYIFIYTLLIEFWYQGNTGFIQWIRVFSIFQFFVCGIVTNFSINLPVKSLGLEFVLRKFYVTGLVFFIYLFLVSVFNYFFWQICKFFFLRTFKRLLLNSKFTKIKLFIIYTYCLFSICRILFMPFPLFYSWYELIVPSLLFSWNIFS